MKNISEVKKKTFGNLPEKILQIGEDNFTMAIVGCSVEEANRKGFLNSSIVVCQPLSNSTSCKLPSQNCLYTVVQCGLDNNDRLFEKSTCITSVSRVINPYESYDTFIKLAQSKDLEIIFSNTTEKGIYFNKNDNINDSPPKSYPAKLTVFLYHRYKFFDGRKDKGLFILPLEQIQNNGETLYNIVLEYAVKWDLESGFIDWLSQNCCFASTLLDRIVTQPPQNDIKKLENKLGYSDNSIIMTEPYMFMIIQADKKWRDKLPLDKAGFNVIFTDDITPYAIIMSKILNCVEIMCAVAALMCGFKTINVTITHNAFLKYIKTILYEEIIPTIDFKESLLKEYADNIIARFSNPCLPYSLPDILENCLSKFKSQILCSILDYIKIYNNAPALLCFGFAILIEFFNCKLENGYYYGKVYGEKYRINDDINVLKFMSDVHQSDDKVVYKILSNKQLWGRDLTQISDLEFKVSYFYNQIHSLGICETLGLFMEI